MNKKEELEKLKEKMEKDKTLPLIEKPEDVIPGYGNPDAKIVLIGEAGGYHESVQRKPFVGAAGQLLTRLLNNIGIKRDDVYITNMVKTRPPQNRDPLPEELKAYERYLDEELEIIKPKVIITLGRFSMGKFLPGTRITSIHGKPHKLKWKDRELTVVPMYHPAAALRRGDIMEQTKEDFARLPSILADATKPEVKQMGLL